MKPVILSTLLVATAAAAPTLMPPAKRPVLKRYLSHDHEIKDIVSIIASYESSHPKPVGISVNI